VARRFSRPVAEKGAAGSGDLRIQPRSADVIRAQSERKDLDLATLLIIDDSETQRALAREVIAPAGIFDEILEASDGLAGLRLLMAKPVDVVLCDLEMPGLEGEKLLRFKVAGGPIENLPFVFLTGSTNAERRAKLLESGACDAIQKPFHPADLLARLRLHLKVRRLQDELREKNTALAELSSVDVLTQLRTRRYVQELLAVEFLRARRYGTPLALCLADLDHFKRVNDSYGHPGGDAVLKRVSELLTQHLRATDVAGRYGGEELILVFPGSAIEGLHTFAERWRVRVAETAIRVPDGREARVTLSAGIAGWHSDLTSPEDLIAAADVALYRAKQQGRNRVELSTPARA
jgi:diguanylate cyclase (GGDEF)-like protein